MIIGIDGNEANNKFRVGVGKYAYELLWALYRKIDIKNEDKMSFQIYLQNTKMHDLPDEREWWTYVKIGSPGWWIEKDLMPYLWSNKLRKNKPPDVFLSPNHYSPIPIPIPSVISIMDLAFHKYPLYFKKSDLFKLKYWTYFSVHQAKKILTISHFTKNEITKYYNIDKSKIEVTYLGIDKVKFNKYVKDKKDEIKKLEIKYGMKGPYLLFIGTAQPRKNLIRLIEAFHEFIKNHEDIKLVIAGMISEGRGGWMYDSTFKIISDLDLKDRIIMTGYISDKDLPILIGGCKALLMPSLYEGFGLSVIEAMSIGIPVVISKNSSLEEIGGKVAIYIDNPYNIDSIVTSLDKLISLGKNELNRKIDEGYKWVRQFNWDNTAKKTLTVLNAFKQ